MKNFVLLVVAVMIVTTLIGCSKKKQEQEAALDSMSNGVMSENVISVGDAMAGASAMVGNGSIPVMVDNAEAVPQSTGDMAMGVDVVSDKPTPKQIQQALKNAGFYSGNVDGNVGPKTKKAIEAFQTHNGLKADGKVGPRTWKALATHLNQALEVENPTAQAQTVGQ